MAKDLLQEELYELESYFTSHWKIDLLKLAIAELEELERLECSGCIHNVDLENLKALSDEESYAMFEHCRNCSNYYENKYTKVK